MSKAMSDITIPLDEITIDNLDIDRIYGVSYPRLKVLGNSQCCHGKRYERYKGYKSTDIRNIRKIRGR